jgi:rRNA maturation endonuclease Nob1
MNENEPSFKITCYCLNCFRHFNISISFGCLESQDFLICKYCGSSFVNKEEGELTDGKNFFTY